MAAPAPVERVIVRPLLLVKASLEIVTDVAESETVQELFVTVGTV